MSNHCYKIAIRFRRYCDVFAEYVPDQLIWLQDAADDERAADIMISHIKTRYSHEAKDAPHGEAVKGFEWEVIDQLY